MTYKNNNENKFNRIYHSFVVNLFIHARDFSERLIKYQQLANNWEYIEFGCKENVYDKHQIFLNRMLNLAYDVYIFDNKKKVDPTNFNENNVDNSFNNGRYDIFYLNNDTDYTDLDKIIYLYNSEIWAK